MGWTAGTLAAVEDNSLDGKMLKKAGWEGCKKRTLAAVHLSHRHLKERYLLTRLDSLPQ